jgi:hypothetical protein
VAESDTQYYGVGAFLLAASEVACMKTRVKATRGSHVEVRVLCISQSLDGFGAGPDQSLENPLGVDGPSMFQWYFPTRQFQKMFGDKPGETGVDNAMGEGELRKHGRRGFSGATCLVRCAVPGPMNPGADGGAKSRPITCPRSCSRITRVRRSS